MTATRHALARRVGEGPGGPAGGEPDAAVREDPVLDVRDLPPARRHKTLFAAYRDLAPGAGFVHDAGVSRSSVSRTARPASVSASRWNRAVFGCSPIRCV